MYSVGIGVRLRLPVVSVGIDVAQALTTPAGSTEPARSAPAPQLLAQIVMKRRLKIAALVFGLLLLLSCAFLAWVIYTEAGLRFAVARLPERMGKVTLQHRGRARHDRRRIRRRPRRHRSRAHVTCASRTATARVNFWPLLVGPHRGARRAGRVSCRSTSSGGRSRHPKTPPKFLPRLLSISAETASARSCSSSSRRTAGASSSTTSPAPASSATRPSASSTATSSTACCTARAIGELRAADPMKLQRRSHHAHDHRRPARLARRCQLRRRRSTSCR